MHVASVNLSEPLARTLLGKYDSAEYMQHALSNTILYCT